MDLPVIQMTQHLSDVTVLQNFNSDVFHLWGFFIVPAMKSVL